MKQKNGSTFIEAAMIFPLVILLVCGMINISLEMYRDVVEDIQKHKEAVQSEESAAGIGIGNLMRGKWILQ